MTSHLFTFTFNSIASITYKARKWWDFLRKHIEHTLVLGSSMRKRHCILRSKSLRYIAWLPVNAPTLQGTLCLLTYG